MADFVDHRAAELCILGSENSAHSKYVTKGTSKGTECFNLLAFNESSGIQTCPSIEEHPFHIERNSLFFLTRIATCRLSLDCNFLTRLSE